MEASIPPPGYPLLVLCAYLPRGIMAIFGLSYLQHANGVLAKGFEALLGPPPAQPVSWAWMPIALLLSFELGYVATVP